MKSEKKSKSSVVFYFLKYDKYIILFLFILLSALLSEKFFTLKNITNLLKQNSAIGIVAIAELIVILTGGIDLSVGSITSLCGIIVALLLKTGVSWPMAVLIAILAGIGVGALNGFLVSVANITPFIATLGGMTIYRGLGLLLSRGRQIFYDNPGFLLLGREEIWGAIPYITIFLIVLAVIIHIFLNNLVAGRFIRGIGGNKEAVRLAGINTTLYESLAYLISGFLCAIAGILMASRLTLGTNVVGQGWELIAIAAVMIGGGSFIGGIGDVAGTIIGVIILGLIGNTMNLAGITIFWQQIIRGIIILLAVFSSTRKTSFKGI
jgi:ribose/xylose/arabinose/galactoside ABC-type transport system permease subunit